MFFTNILTPEDFSRSRDLSQSRPKARSKEEQVQHTGSRLVKRRDSDKDVYILSLYDVMMCVHFVSLLRRSNIFLELCTTDNNTPNVNMRTNNIRPFR